MREKAPLVYINSACPTSNSPMMSGRTSAELGAPLSKSRTAGGSPQGPCILQDLVHGILRFPIMLGQAMYIDLLEPLVIAAITERQEYQLMPPMS